MVWPYRIFLIAVFLPFVCCSSSGGPSGNIVFVSKSKGNADFKTWEHASGLSGKEAADAVCQKEANMAGLSGIFKAWLSSSDEDAKERIGPNSRGWIRTDGHPFAVSLEDLLDSPTPVAKEKDSHKGPLVPIRYHADGTLADPTVVFTNTKPDGTGYIRDGDVPPDCEGWNSSQDSDHAGIAGYSESSTVNWTDNGAAISVNCSGTAALYCFQRDEEKYRPVNRNDYKSKGRLAFVSSVKGPGDFGSGNWFAHSDGESGLLGADKICRSLALAQGIDNHEGFKAFISTTVPSVVNALDRFAYSGPWVLKNGVKLAENKDDFRDGTIFTNLDIDERGRRIHDNFHLGYNFVWSGSDSLGDAVIFGNDTHGVFIDNLNCMGWSSADTVARVGKFSRADLEWIAFTVGGNDFFSCANHNRIYCFEDE